MKIIARTFAGLEEILEKEIISLGGTETIIRKRAVEFKGYLETLYKVNIWSRFALDVLTPIHKFQAKTTDQLYKGVLDINWSKYMSEDSTFAIKTIVYSSHFNHSQFAALKVKDAIVDQFREKTGVRPDVDTYKPDLAITLRISEHKCEILLNSSGAPLFKRGYRRATGAAPLNEVLAASLIEFSGWNYKTPFIDPMCGSGTIVLEAAMRAKNMAPGLVRKDYSFQKWKNYDSEMYETMIAEAKSKVRDTRVIIKGYDNDLEMVQAAKFNLKNLPGVSRNVTFDKQDFFTLEKPFKKAFIVMNPPYDKRIELLDTESFYNKIGTQLKHHFEDCDAFILSSNLDALKRIGLKPNKKTVLYNGPDESKFNHYQLYSGSKRYEPSMERKKFLQKNATSELDYQEEE